MHWLDRFVKRHFGLKRGPHNDIPDSGMRHGFANRQKLVRHIKASIAIEEFQVEWSKEKLRHMRRALIRAKGERIPDLEGDE